MTSFDTLSWALTLLTITGSLQTALRNKVCFIILGIANFGSCSIALYQNNLPQAFMFLCLFCIKIYGYRNWQELENQQEKHLKSERLRYLEAGLWMEK